MADLKLYASLGVKLNDSVLQEQCAITVESRVGRPTRVTVESAVPFEGLEVDGRARMGETVKLAVHLMAFQECGPAVLEIHGPIVAAVTKQSEVGNVATTSFTVEQQPTPIVQIA